MNSTGLGRGGWLAHLVAAIVLMVVMSGMAAAATVSGTVTNNSTKTGRVYLLVLQQMGGSTSSGVSVAPLAPGDSTSYTINGVPDGNFFMFALLDTQNIGTPHANDPTGMSSNFSVSGASVNGVNLTLFDAEPPTFDKMGAPGVMASANGVLLDFEKPSNNNGIQLADSFNVYWSTGNTPGSTAGGGMKNFAATDRGPIFLSPPSIAPGTDYYFSVAPVVGGVEQTAALSDVSEKTTTADLSGGTSISGTVDLSAVSGLSGSTPLYMAAVDENSGVFVTAISAPAASQPYTIPGVQPGFYSIYAILDMNNSGTFDVGTLLNQSNDKSQPVVLVPPNAPESLTAAGITLAPKNAQVKVTTTHSRSNGSDYYSLGFQIESVNREVVNVSIGSGPQISGPIDLSPSTSGGFGYWKDVSSRPAVGDSYPVTVYYASGVPASETINAVVTAVLDNFATAAYPPANGTIPSGQFPNFAWRPTTPTGYFTYQASVNTNWGGGDNKSLPLYSLSGKNQSYLGDGSYTWNLSVQDDHGNQATLQTSFTVNSPATPPSISSFSPASGKVGDVITINGSGFSSTAAQNMVSFNGTTSVPAATVNGSGTQLTVTVPGSTPLSGPIGVTVNGVQAVSDGEFNGTIKYESYLFDKSGTTPVSGATATLVENPAVTAAASAVDGLFSFPGTAGIPSGRFFTLRFSTGGAGGYLDSYSAFMTNGTNVSVANGNTSNYNLFTDADLSGWGVTRTAGKGVIRSRVQSMDSGSAVNLSGATVTATSKMHPDLPYTVKYTNGSGTISSGTSTAGDGMFYVLDVDEGDYVTVTAGKSGMAFNARVFATHGNAVHQGSIRGASTATSTASLPSGNYSGTQTVTLSIVPPATSANFDIIYTTNGNDPSFGGTTYTSPISISSTTTLKFFARNKAAGAGFAVESPYNTRVYNFDGVITGTVTAANGGAAVPNIPVQLFDANGNPMQGTGTDASGNYTLGGLTTGNYKVCFYSGPTDYIPQCYNNKPDAASADTIAVTAPNTSSNINAVLVQGGIISGRVTSNGTNGIQNVWISLNDTNGNQVPGINGGNTDQDGFYTLRGIPTGTYKIYFGGQASGYIGQWYSNKTDAAAADPFPVIAGTTYNNVDAQLALGGTISGRVTRDGINGIQNVMVQLRDTSGNWIPSMPGANTDPNGNYTLGGIPAGSYKLYFDGMSTGYIGEWFDNVADQSLASTLVVTAGGNLTGKDAILSQGGSISGRVTRDGVNGIQNVNVQLRDTSGNWIPNIGGAFTDFNGNYTLGGLPPGSYKLYFDGSSAGYIGEWFDNAPDQSTAVTIPVSAGANLTGFNAVLAPGATISGTVTNGTSGIQNISVQLFDSAGTQILFNTNTDATGGYQFSGLQAGTYKVCFSAGQTYYIGKCYNNQVYDPSAATGIAVGVPGSATANATLALGGGISGQVTNGSSGIQNVSVEIRDTATGNPVSGVVSMWTDMNGNYDVRGIPAGSIRVYFNPNMTSYAGQWYNNKTNFASSDTVSISAGMTSSLGTAVLQAATVPGAPVIDSVIPGNGYVQVNFNPPASDGGLQIQDYTVTVNPGGMTGFGLGSPVYVYGLTNGQNYTVSVTARNNLGNGAAASTPYSLPMFVGTFNDLQAAVAIVANGGTLWTQSGQSALSFPPLMITKGVTISGGYNPDYSWGGGVTTIPGRVNIQGTGFKVVFKNVRVKAP